MGNVKNGVRVSTSVTAAGKTCTFPRPHNREHLVARLHIAVESPNMPGSAHQHLFIPGHIHRSAFARGNSSKSGTSADLLPHLRNICGWDASITHRGLFSGSQADTILRQELKRVHICRQ